MLEQPQEVRNPSYARKTTGGTEPTLWMGEASCRLVFFARLDDAGADKAGKLGAGRDGCLQSLHAVATAGSHLRGTCLHRACGARLAQHRSLHTQALASNLQFGCDVPRLRWQLVLDISAAAGCVSFLQQPLLP